MILNNQGRLVLNDQSITLPNNEPQRSPAFLQKQPLECSIKKVCSDKWIHLAQLYTIPSKTQTLILVISFLAKKPI